MYIKKDMPRWLNMPCQEKDVAVFFNEDAFYKIKRFLDRNMYRMFILMIANSDLVGDFKHNTSQSCKLLNCIVCVYSCVCDYN